MREPLSPSRWQEIHTLAWNPVYRPPDGTPERYHHDALRDAVDEARRLRGLARNDWPANRRLMEILADHHVMMRSGHAGQLPPLLTDLMQWAALTVESETCRLREELDQARAKVVENAALDRPEINKPENPSLYRAACEAAAAALPAAVYDWAERVAVAVLRVALPMHETQHADALQQAAERATHFELEATRRTEERDAARVVVATLEREVEWAHQVSSLDGTWAGDEVPQADEQSAHIAAGIIRHQLDPSACRVDVICRDVWSRTTEWRKADNDSVEEPQARDSGDDDKPSA